MAGRTHHVPTDWSLPLAASGGGHNRWHPDIPPVATIASGDTIVAGLRDGLDVQVTEATTDSDVTAVDMRRGHPMAGPFAVEGARPGDVLEVEVISIVPDEFGYTNIIPGFGLLEDEFTEPFLVKWHIYGGCARSPSLPSVTIPVDPFIGLLGVAPSHERMRLFAAREAELAERGGVVLPPEAGSAVPADGPPAQEGLRTVPPRETGGNLDVKHLRAGSRIRLPVDTPGALLSVGDIHVAQGDGESCGVAIEACGTVELRVTLHPGGMPARTACPVIETAAGSERAPGPCIVTTGLPIDADGRNQYLDVRLSARNALADMIAYLTSERGLSREQAYVLCSVAVDLRIGSIVNVPNSVVSAVLPLEIFNDEPEAS